MRILTFPNKTPFFHQDTTFVEYGPISRFDLQEHLCEQVREQEEDGYFLDDSFCIRGLNEEDNKFIDSLDEMITRCIVKEGRISLDSFLYDQDSSCFTLQKLQEKINRTPILVSYKVLVEGEDMPEEKEKVLLPDISLLDSFAELEEFIKKEYSKSIPTRQENQEDYDLIQEL